MNIVNKHALKFLVILATFALGGCSGFVQMMPRDSGKVYSGAVQGSATGSGTMTIDIEGQIYSGPIMRTSTSDSFGLIQQFNGRGLVGTTTVANIGGNATVKALLSTSTGRGLRCEFNSTGSGGAGVCVDDPGRVYDALVGR